MLPINKTTICERILKSGHYQFPNSKGREDRWLIAYLKKKGLSEKEIYDLWNPVFFTKHDKDDVETAKMAFDRFYHQTYDVKFDDKVSSIVFYEKEIEDIRSTDAKPWEKEALMLLYAVVKSQNKKTLSFLPISDILPMTSLSIRRGCKTGDVVDTGVKFGLIEVVHNTQWDYTVGEYYDVFSYRFPKLKTSGKELERFDCILDVPDVFRELFWTKRCVVCGEEFEFSAKTKRDMCQKCYVQYRQKYLNKRWHDWSQYTNISITYSGIEDR